MTLPSGCCRLGLATRLSACDTPMIEQSAQPDAIPRSTKGAKMAGNAQFVQGLYEAFAKGDAPTVLGAMDPGIEWTEAEHGAFWPGHSFIGPEAVLEGVFARTRATCGETSVSKSTASLIAARWW